MKEIVEQVLKFRDERNWKQFHNVKDLLIGLSIEVAELEELFLWNTNTKENIDKKEIQNEIADIFIFLVYIADKYNIDLEQAIKNKLEIHRIHYPIEQFKNKSIKYNKLKPKKDE